MDVTEIINKFLKHDSIQKQNVDETVLVLRSQTTKKVDCAMTVINTVEPLIKVIRMNVFVYIVVMLGFALLGSSGLFLGLLGVSFNLYYSKKQSELMLNIQEKYKLR